MKENLVLRTYFNLYVTEEKKNDDVFITEFIKEKCLKKFNLNKLYLFTKENGYLIHFLSALFLSGETSLVSFFYKNKQLPIKQTFEFIVVNYIEKCSESQIKNIIFIMMLRLIDFDLIEYIYILENTLIENNSKQALYYFITAYYLNLSNDFKINGIESEDQSKVYKIDNVIKYAIDDEDKYLIDIFLQVALFNLKESDLQRMLTIYFSRQENFNNPSYNEEFKIKFRKDIVEKFVLPFFNNNVKNGELFASYSKLKLNRINLLIETIKEEEHVLGALILLEDLFISLPKKEKLELIKLVLQKGNENDIEILYSINGVQSFIHAYFRESPLIMSKKLLQNK